MPLNSDCRGAGWTLKNKNIFQIYIYIYIYYVDQERSGSNFQFFELLY
jgi:hypothetical protein